MMNNAYKTQNIFISSTFLDMQLERDLLNKRVLPVIKEYAKKYRINIELIDLRFGIDIGNVNEIDKIVKTCENEIERCKPLFIGLIGNRYGTIFKDDLSITALEIHHSISNDYKTLFYSRKIINKEEMPLDEINKYYDNEDKIAILKKNINREIKEYNAKYDIENRTLELDKSFMDLVINDIKLIIDSEYNQVDLKTYLSSYLDYSFYLSSSYISIFTNLEKKLEKIKDIKEKIMLLYAPSGQGKSMLIAKAANYFLEQNYQIISYSPETNNGKGHFLDLLNSYLEDLSLNNKKEYHYLNDIQEALDIFYDLINELDQEIIFICDSYESIYFDQEITKASWLKLDEIPLNVKFLLATNLESDLNILKYDAKIIMPDLINEEGIRKYLKGYLIRKSIKVSSTFFNTIINHLTNLKDKSLLYISTSIDYLFYNDRKDAKKISDIQKSNELDDAVLAFYLNKLTSLPSNFDELLFILINKKLELSNQEVSKIILTSLVNAKAGLKEKDLEDICNNLNVSYLSSDFAYLRYVLDGMIHQSASGTYLISHEYAQKTLKNKYNELKIKNSLVDVLLNLDNSNEYKHVSLIRLLYETNRKEEIIEVFKNSYDKSYLKEYTKDVLDILENDFEIIDLLAGALDDRSFSMYLINYLLPNTKISNHEYLLNKVKEIGSTSYYNAALICSTFKKNRDLDVLLDASLLIDISLDLGKVADQILFIKLLMDVGEYLLNISEYYGASRYLSLVSSFIKLIPLKERTKEIWGILANCYLLFAKLFFNAQMTNFVRDYFNEAKEIFKLHSLSINEMSRFIITSLDLINNINSYDLNLKINIDEDLYNLALRYRNESKSFDSIYLYLKVKFKYLSNYRILNEEELVKEIQDFYIHSLNPKVKLLEHLVLAKLELNKEDNLNLNKLIETVENSNFLIEEYNASLNEVEEVLMIYGKIMQLVHQNDNRKVLHKEYKEVYLKAKDLVDKYNSSDALYKSLRREIYFYYSFLDEVDKVSLLEEVIKESYDLYKNNPSEENLQKIVNETYYYCDAIGNQDYNKKLQALSKVLSCINHFNECVKMVETYLYYKAYFYIALTAIYSKELDIAYTYAHKMITSIYGISKEYISESIMFIAELYYCNYECLNDGDNRRKELSNYLYDSLNKINSQYLESLGYIRFNEDSQKTLSLHHDLKENSVIDFQIVQKNQILMLLDISRTLEIPSFNFGRVFKDELPKYEFIEYSAKIVLEELDGSKEEKIKKCLELIDNNNSYGYYYLGLVYEDENLIEALKYYKDGERLDNPMCAYALGAIYHAKIKDYNVAFEYLYKAASLGYYVAIGNLLDIYKALLDQKEGAYEVLLEGCRKNLMKDIGHPIAQKSLKYAKLCLEYGGLDPEKYEWFIRYYEMANLTNFNGGTLQKAVGYNDLNKEEYFLNVARFGAIISKDGNMMAYLSYAYLFGIGVSLNYKKAYEWCIKAIEHNDITMGLNIFNAIFYGYGTYESDLNVAKDLLVKIFKVSPLEEVANKLFELGIEDLEDDLKKRIMNLLK